MRKLPPLKAIKIFEAAARHESLTLAAGELNVSVSAVSQQIRILEAYFQKPLFAKQGRALKLTPPARAYLEDIRACLDRLALASEQMAGSHKNAAIRVNTTPSFAMRWLIPNLPSFQRKHPQTEVNIVTSPLDSIDDLHNSFDIVIRRDQMERTGHECHKFLDDIMIAVASPKLPGIEHITSAKSLKKSGKLLHLKSRSDAWARWLKNANISAPQTLTGQYFDHFFLSLQAAINGLGIALAPRVLVSDDIAQGQLVQLCREHTLEGPGFHCLFREDTQSDRTTAPFLQWLINDEDETTTG
ncbi:LysR substrate-binding domain-containing protein [Kiloniella sp.]|uniref:LysR substrate-binding domain-containing protein n=1 Tax=Kiloniella sp. TaxID=1938587 RepID=UPI003B015DE0